MRHYSHPVIEQDEIEAVNKVLQSGVLSGYRANKEHELGGEAVRAFEAEFKAYHGVKHSIAFNSATSALHVALIACGIGSNDEVITSPFTFSASASCIKMAGADVVFADIRGDTFTLTPVKVRALATGMDEGHIRHAVFNQYPIPARKTNVRAIIPVHLMGHSAEMNAIMFLARECNIKVVEDASQALGAEYHRQKVGTFGDCGVFSFNQSKPISVGEGGMLITNDDKIAEIARAVRNHGEVSTDLNILGYNYRMGEMEAALGLAQFRKLDERNKHRIKLANHLTEALNKIDGLTPPYVAPDCKHVYYTYGVNVDEAKIGMSKRELQKRLIARGIYFGWGNQKPLHLYPFYGGHKGQFPVAERISRELMFTDILRDPMTIEDVDEIIAVIEGIMSNA